MNQIFSVKDIVFVPCYDSYGEIIDLRVNEDSNTEYMIIFDDGTWNTYLGHQLREER